MPFKNAVSCRDSCWRHLRTDGWSWRVAILSAAIYSSIACKPCGCYYLLAQHANEHFKQNFCFWVPQLHYYNTQFHSPLNTLKLVQLISSRGLTEPQHKYLTNSRRSRMKIHTYLWSRVRIENLVGTWFVKKFPTCYGTCRFIPAFTKARYLSLFWTRSTFAFRFFKINYNNIIPSRPRSSKWSLSFRFQH